MMETMRECSPVDLEDEAGRQRFFGRLLNALHDRDPNFLETFAACQSFELVQLDFNLNSLEVEGAGKLKIPLAPESAWKLHNVCEQAPFGRGSYRRGIPGNTSCGTATVRDSEMPSCWQVDSSKVTFPDDPTFLSNKVQELAVEAVCGDSGLGADWLRNVEAHFDKVLLCELGGHFPFRRVTEKESWMFGTLIVQIPMVELYTGGKQVVKHRGEVKEFDCSCGESGGYYYTVFYADCLHELQEIKTGARLCLVFNLVCPGGYTGEATPRRVRRVREAMAPWFEAVTDVNVNFIKLCIPLEHKYTRANLSFNALKGHDVVIAAVMKRKRWGTPLDVYLCLVTKYKKRIASNKRVPMGESSHERVTFENVVDKHNKPSYRVWNNGIMHREIVSADGDPFHEEPNSKEYEEEHGNVGRMFKYEYHSAMLIVHPKPRAQPRGRPPSSHFPQSSEQTSNWWDALERFGGNLFVPVTDVAIASTVANEAGLRDSKRPRLERGEVLDDRKQTAMSTPTLTLNEVSRDVRPGPRGGGDGQRRVERGEVSDDRNQTAMSEEDMSTALALIELSRDVRPGPRGGGDGQRRYSADEKGKTKYGEDKRL